MRDELEVSATYLHSEVEDFIEWRPVDPTDPFSFWAPENIPEARLQGIELATELRLSTALTLHADATWQDLVVRSTGKKLARWAKRSAKLGATYLWESGAHLNATVQYVGPRFNDRANTTTLDSYARVDLAGSLPIRENLSLFGRVENIGDVDYREVNGYTVPGRTARVGLRLDF
ncbi:MAG TPA: hypothetical protein DCR55_10130 [Lentisphaeria bacterium]|nr:hypothetical protein [Lentisphaeria bacterium]